MERAEFNGWQDNVRLANGEIELMVTTQVGPRVVRVGFIGERNLFAEIEGQQGGTGEEEWMIRGGHRFWIAPEEKRTDVNIAVTMVDDAYQDLCERFVIVSGDSDLVPAVDQVKARFPDKEVIVYVPARTRIRGAATELRGAADKDRTLPLRLLRHCQLPVSIIDGAGVTIQKPAGW